DLEGLLLDLPADEADELARVRTVWDQDRQLARVLEEVVLGERRRVPVVLLTAQRDAGALIERLLDTDLREGALELGGDWLEFRTPCLYGDDCSKAHSSLLEVRGHQNGVGILTSSTSANWSGSSTSLSSQIFQNPL